MKKLFILFIGLILSCGTKDTKEIQEILDQKNYKIEYKFQGCFGGGTESLEIKNNEIALYTYLNLNDSTGSFEKTRQIPWDLGKQKLLKEIFETEGEISGLILYWIDNEIHHRGQGYVYLRSLGIEPPAFWDRH